MQKMLTAWLARLWVLLISTTTVSVSIFILVALMRIFCEVGKYAWTLGGLLQ